MKALAVSHNGQKLAVVGTSGNGMSMLSVHCVENGQTHQAAVQLILSRASFEDDESTDSSWPLLALAVGDEITIHIVDVESDDPPPKCVPNRPKRPPRSENRGDDFDFDSRFGRFK